MIKEQLEELSIFALRELARNKGVKSPTSKKKEELISEIVAIANGVQEPCFNKTKQGRPPKGFNYSNVEIFDMPSKKLSFQQNVPAFVAGDLKSVCGYVEIANTSAYLWVENQLSFDKYFILPDLLLNQELRPGDKIIAEVGSSENDMIVKNILNINNRPISKEQRANYFDIEHQIPNKQITFAKPEHNNLKICYGENVFLYGNNNNNNTIASIDLLNGSNVNHKIYINTSIAEKNKIYLKSLQDAEIFVSKITDSQEIAMKIVAMAIERAKRLFEIGESVAIVVDDMLSLTSVDTQDLMLTKTIAGLTKNGDNSSITLFAVMPNKEISAIEKLADKRFEIQDLNIQEKITTK